MSLKAHIPPLFFSSSLVEEGKRNLSAGGTLNRWRSLVRDECQQKWHLTLIVCLSLLSAYALVCWLRLGGEIAIKDLSNFFNTFASLSGSLCCFACARSSQNGRRWRLAWGLMGIGWGLNSLGEAQWVLVETLQRREVPSPGWSDLFFELAYPCLLVALACFFVGTRHQQKTRAILDSALIASAFGALVWFFVLQPVWLERDFNAPLGTWISVSYPLFDVFIAWGALALAGSGIYQGRQQRAISLIALSMGFYACSDLIYAFLDISGEYQTGGWCDVVSVAAYLSVALGALLTLWSKLGVHKPPVERELPSLGRSISPYGFMIVVLGIVTVHQWTATKRFNLDVLLWAILFLGLVLMRQMLALVENVQMARELRELNTNLDTQVQSRTRQLDALLQLSKAVNSTLLEDDVVEQAALSARRAIQVHAAGVWLWSEAGGQISLAACDTTPYISCKEHTEELTELASLESMMRSESALALAQNVASEGAAGDWRGDMKHIELGERDSPTVVPCLHLEPVRYREQVLGVLGALRLVESTDALPFASDETRLLENVGLEIGTALENARTYARAVEAADLDPVTGLLNHRAMQGRFEAAWAKSQTQGTPLSVVMMDLNNFKGFNDTYGHLAGDEVLRLVATSLTQSCRSRDFVARYGGDEFFMLLPDTDTADALRVAERLREAMDDVEFRPSGAQESLPVTLSFGVASSPRDARTKIELLSLADRNLYVAKGSRDQIRGTSDATRERRALLSNDAVATLDSMVTAISNFDAYTRQHSEDVTEYALWIAEELGLSTDTLRTIRVGGMLHDVGKICVPQDVLKKPGKLNDEEFAAMRTHPLQGALLVGAILPDAGVLDIVRNHHERFDGLGYPNGLSGEDIPLLGRVVAVADAFSAMTTSRPYRKALSFEQARFEIELGTGTQFDPRITEAFLCAFDKRIRLREAALESSQRFDSTIPVPANVH